MIIYRWVLAFLLYSFIGWLYETILCSITQRKFVYRGFLNGPICPIYGFGALAVILTLWDVQNNILALFMSSMIVTTVLEYLTSFAMEKMFEAKWWDYSHMKFNLNGRVCLLGAVVFGIMSVIVIRFVHPMVWSLVSKIPESILPVLCTAILIILIADFYITVYHLLKMKGKLREIQVAINSHMQQAIHKSEAIRAALYERFENSDFYSTRIKTLINDRKLQEIRLLQAFPRLSSTKYKEALEKIKNRLIKNK